MLNYELILNEDANSVSDNELEESVKLDYGYVLNENKRLMEEMSLQESTSIEFAYRLQVLCTDIDSPKEITDDFKTDINVCVNYFNIRDNHTAKKANGTTQMFLSNGKEAKDAASLRDDIKALIQNNPKFEKLNTIIKNRPWVLQHACDEYFKKYNPKTAGVFATKGSLKSVGASNLTSPIDKTI